MDYTKKVQDKRQQKKLKEQEELQRKQLLQVIAAGNKQLSQKLKDNKSVSIDNLPDNATPEDVRAVVDALNSLSDRVAPSELKSVVSSLESVVANVGTLAQAIPEFPEFPEIPKFPKKITVDNLDKIQPWLQEVVEAVGNIKVDPQVNVEAPEVTVENEVDLSPLIDELKQVTEKLDNLEQPEVDLSKLVESVKKTTEAVNNLKFPVPNYILPFKDQDGKAVQVQLDADGKVPTSGGAGGSSGTQYTEGDTDTTITGTAVMWEDSADTLRSVSASKPLPVDIKAGSSSGTEYTEDDAAVANPAGGAISLRRRDTLSSEASADGDWITANSTSKGELYVKHSDTLTVDGSGVTQPVSASSLPLPTGASTAANQSTIIGHVDGLEGLLTTIDAVLDTIKTDTEAIETAIEGTLSVASEKASSASTSTGISVGATSTTVLASNTSRKAAIIVNDSDETIYLKYGTGATANSGIRLNAGGGMVREELYTGIITGICASGSKNVTVTEI